MTVVSDTSPINYLVLIELQDLLQHFSSMFSSPVQFGHELQSLEAPVEIRKWMTNSPNWLEYREVTNTPADLRQHDAGEREAIALAQNTNVELILLDEKKGRQAAQERRMQQMQDLRESVR